MVRVLTAVVPVWVTGWAATALVEFFDARRMSQDERARRIVVGRKHADAEKYKADQFLSAGPAALLIATLFVWPLALPSAVALYIRDSFLIATTSKTKRRRSREQRP